MQLGSVLIPRMIRGYLVDVADPAGYLLSDWTCDGGYNLAHIATETDHMIQDAGRHRGIDPRTGQYAEIAAKLQSEAASLFLLHEAAVWALGPTSPTSSRTRRSTTSSLPTSPSAVTNKENRKTDE
jgi:hypothetical protein